MMQDFTSSPNPSGPEISRARSNYGSIHNVDTANGSVIQADEVEDSSATLSLSPRPRQARDRASETESNSNNTTMGKVLDNHAETRTTQTPNFEATNSPVARYDTDSSEANMSTLYRNSSSHNQSHSNYEELLGGAITCPTCHGFGQIPRDKENELVALIPMSDNRLKPRRTTLWVFLTVFVCFVLAGLLVFFLFPRSVLLSSDMPALIPTYLAINKTEQYVFMSITNEYNVTNDNFYSVQVSNLIVAVYFDQKILHQASNNSVIKIAMKSWRTHYISLNVTFEGDEGYIAEYCSNSAKYGHTLLMPFNVQISTSILGRTENSTLETYQHVRCSDNKY